MLALLGQLLQDRALGRGRLVGQEPVQQPLHRQRLLLGAQPREVHALAAGVLLDLGDEAAVLDPVDQQRLGNLDHRRGLVAASQRREVGGLGGGRQFADQPRPLVARRRRVTGDIGGGILAIGHGRLRFSTTYIEGADRDRNRGAWRRPSCRAPCGR